MEWSRSLIVEFTTDGKRIEHLPCRIKDEINIIFNLLKEKSCLGIKLIKGDNHYGYFNK